LEKKIPKFKVENIAYDTDGEDVVLPKKLEFMVPDNIAQDVDELEQYLSDKISEKTGFCHDGFRY